MGLAAPGYTSWPSGLGTGLRTAGYMLLCEPGFEYQCCHGSFAVSLWADGLAPAGESSPPSCELGTMGECSNQKWLCIWAVGSKIVWSAVSREHGELKNVLSREYRYVDMRLKTSTLLYFLTRNTGSVSVLRVKAKQATFTDITCPQMGRGEGSAE